MPMLNGPRWARAEDVTIEQRRRAFLAGTRWRLQELAARWASDHYAVETRLQPDGRLMFVRAGLDTLGTIGQWLRLEQWALGKGGQWALGKGDGPIPMIGTPP